MDRCICITMIAIGHRHLCLTLVSTNQSSPTNHVLNCATCILAMSLDASCLWSSMPWPTFRWRRAGDTRMRIGMDGMMERGEKVIMYWQLWKRRGEGGWWGADYDECWHGWEDSGEDQWMETILENETPTMFLFSCSFPLLVLKTEKGKQILKQLFSHNRCKKLMNWYPKKDLVTSCLMLWQAAMLVKYKTATL